MEFLQTNARRIVVKIGTNTLTSGGRGIDLARVQCLASQIATLRQRGLECIVVSSGAIGLGMAHLKMDARPTDLPTLQACAAIGQMLLMETWQRAFSQHQTSIAQILLTHEDVRGRRRHLAISETLDRLLDLGVVPIVNENDTVSADEIKFGDNDCLSALVASLVKADLLVILSTIPGLLDLSTGTLVPLVETITPEIEALAGGTDSPTAVGGMISKIQAAKLAIRSGCGVFIGDGSSESLLVELTSGNATGTYFVPEKMPLGARKRWIAFFQRPTGSITIDSGALVAIRDHGKSLLAKGTTAVSGKFEAEEVISILDPNGKVVARGQSAFAASDVAKILGASTDELRQRYPKRTRFELIHRDQLVIL